MLRILPVDIAYYKTHAMLMQLHIIFVANSPLRQYVWLCRLRTFFPVNGTG